MLAVYTENSIDKAVCQTGSFRLKILILTDGTIVQTEFVKRNRFMGGNYFFSDKKNDEHRPDV